MLENTNLTQLYTLFFGLYFCAASVGILYDPDSANKMIREFSASPALGYLVGILAFTIGVVIVISHNRWETPQESIVSFIGWAALIEGLAFLAFRKKLLDLISRFNFSKGFITLFCMFIIALGLVMILLGLDAL